MSTITPEAPALTIPTSPINHHVETITPERAEELLAQHPRNRRLSENRVAEMVAHMRGGTWVFDGAPIRLDEDGSLVDGQHRLTAIITAGIPQPMLVITGVAREAMTTMDTGKSRSFGDMLVIEDNTLTDVNNLAAGIRIAALWEAGARGRTLRNANKQMPNAVDPTRLMIFFRERRDELLEIVRHASRVRANTPGISHQTASLVLWVLREVEDRDEVDTFLELIKDGVGLPADSPILALRKRLIGITQSPRGSRRFAVEEGAALIFKAWNAWRNGDPVVTLAYRAGGAHPEPYPEPDLT